MNRFTAYRRNISQRDTHNEMQKNADHEPQFEGVIWSDGTVTLRWLTACRSTSVWASIKDCLNIHGHPEYGTEIVWHDAEAPQEWTDQVEAALAQEEQEPVAWIDDSGHPKHRLYRQSATETQDFARCESNPLLEQCKQCARNVNNSPVHPKAARQSWIGPWTGHGPCPNGDFVEVEDE